MGKGNYGENDWNNIKSSYNFFTKHVFVDEYQTIFTYQPSDKRARAKFNNNGWKYLMRDLFYLFDPEANDYSSVTEYSDVRKKIKSIAEENTAQGITYKQLKSFLLIIFEHIYSSFKEPETNAFSDLNVSLKSGSITTFYNDHGSQIRKYTGTNNMLSTMIEFCPQYYWDLEGKTGGLNEGNTKKMIDNTNILLSLLINHKNFWYTKGSSPHEQSKEVSINNAFNLFVKKSSNIKRDYYKMPRRETPEQRLLSKWDGVDYIRGDKKKDLYATTIYADSETEKQEFIDILKEGRSGAVKLQLILLIQYLSALNTYKIFTMKEGELEKRIKVKGGKRRKSLKKRRKTKRKSLKKRRKTFKKRKN